MLGLRSRITQKILPYFFLHPYKEIYLNQMARLFEVDRGNLVKKLAELEREGLLMSEFRGNQRYYRLNPDYPFLKEYKTIFEKTFGVESFIKKVFSPIPGIQKLILFGSYVRNEMDPESDIDLLVEGTTPHLELEKAALLLQKKIHRAVNIVDFSESEFRARINRKDPFLSDVLGKPHINII